MPRPEPDNIPVRLVRNATMRNARLTGKQKPSGDQRSEARRDRDRVVYSTAWRRLAGVTQVISPFDENALVHNRLTHSEKVAQVARTIAERLLNDPGNWELIEHLGGIDVDVVEAAALAHDLGHPPFGHAGEHALDTITRGSNGLDLAEGFDGNAQTLRTVLLTETRHAEYDGMDLTSATLAAIVKYPWLRAGSRHAEHESGLKNDMKYRRQWHKFGVYLPESAAFEQSRKFLHASGIGKNYPSSAQSIESSIMDIADDISYAVHDLEDFILTGVLDLKAIYEIIDESGNDADFLTPLRTRLYEDYPDYYDAERFEEARRRVAGDLKLSQSRPSESNLYRIGQVRRLGSVMISRFIENIHLKEKTFWTNGPFVALEVVEWHEMQILKEITKNFVVNRPDVALLQHGQEELLKRLVVFLREWQADESDYKRLPRRLRSETEIARAQHEGYKMNGTDVARAYATRGNKRRCIIDYVCSLTDGQCYSLYQKLVGAKFGPSGMDFFS